MTHDEFINHWRDTLTGRGRYDTLDVPVDDCAQMLELVELYREKAHAFIDLSGKNERRVGELVTGIQRLIVKAQDPECHPISGDWNLVYADSLRRLLGYDAPPSGVSLAEWDEENDA